MSDYVSLIKSVFQDSQLLNPVRKDDLAEMVLVPNIGISFLQILAGEHPLIHDRLDVVGLDGPVHFFELDPIAHFNSSHQARLQ